MGSEEKGEGGDRGDLVEKKESPKGERAKYHWRPWGVLPVSQPHRVCPGSRCVCFHSLHCSGSRLLCQELSEAGPGLSALRRSKPFRFRFSGIPYLGGVPNNREWWRPCQVGMACSSLEGTATPQLWSIVAMKCESSITRFF